MTQWPPVDPNPGCYEIQVGGHLDPRWASWFEGLTLTHTTEGTTVLDGPIVDQAALHGVLRRLADLGLTLLTVTRVPADSPDPTPTELSEGDHDDQ